MSTTRKSQKLFEIIAALRHRVAQDDGSAMTDLAMWLMEGFRDRKGRVIVRSNPAYAFRLFKAAAGKGEPLAFSSLGYAYDLGLGTSQNKRQAVRWYTRAYRDGQSLGAANLATIYRDRGDCRTMLRWWIRAAALGDGDSMTDAGYCYQYGIGVRKDVAAARRLYRRAIASRDISMWGREEALYQLGVSYVDAAKPQLALPLLKRAAKDGDYPEAQGVLEGIRSGRPIEPCRCRRFIVKSLNGHAKCAMHARRS